MNDVTMKSTFADKCKEVIRLLRCGALGILYRKIVRYGKHLLGTEAHFTYFVFSLDRPFPNFNLESLGHVYVAGQNDRARIQLEIVPFISDDEENDKRYFKLLGQPGVSCFLAEKAGVLIHYTWLFWDAMQSPLSATHFPKELIQEGDGYVGPAFTSPSARGTWIYPHVLAKVLSFAKETAKRKRVILFVNGKNPSSVNFFERLGFQKL